MSDERRLTDADLDVLGMGLSVLESGRVVVDEGMWRRAAADGRRGMNAARAYADIGLACIALAGRVALGADMAAAGLRGLGLAFRRIDRDRRLRSHYWRRYVRRGRHVHHTRGAR